MREVLRAPIDAVIERDRPDAPRTRVGRGAVWLAVLAAPLVLVLSLESDPSFDLGGLQVVAAIATTVTVALLGLRPLIAWRLAVATCLVWMVLVVDRTGGSFVWPTTQIVVLLVAAPIVFVRYRRSVTWGVWFWTEVILVMGANDDAVIMLLLLLTAAAALIDSGRQRARAQAEAEHERGARAQTEVHSLVLEEKARIARDLHDVVAHHMSMVAVQAETAQYRITGLDEPARAEFASIAESARAALSDVRGILTVLRGSGDAERAPQPTLADVDALVESARAVGTRVDLAVGGEQRPLRTAVEIGAYRILQESLANAARHAPGAAVAVVLWYGEVELELTVTNDAPPDGALEGALADDVVPAESPPERADADDAAHDGVLGAPLGGPARGEVGHGLIGMRERVGLLGGRLTAGPTSTGGFRVAARLPIEAADQ